MAPKRSTPMEDPPSASSSSEEEEEETGGEEEAEEEEEEEPEKSGGGEEEEEEEEEDGVEEIQKPLPLAPSQPGPGKSQEEEETESDSGTDSESERPKSVSNSNVKPILSKPVDSRPKGKAIAASGKRGAEVDGDGDGKEPKRAKSDGVEKSSSEDIKKQPFQRIWSEEDEVAVLEGLIKFGGKRGADAVKDIASFHESIKKDLHIDVSFTQLKHKIFSLKRKFDKKRKGKLGEGKTFNKEHDQKIFDTSKRIWGGEVALEASVKANGMVKAKDKANVGGSGSKVESKNFAEMNFDRSGGMEEYVIRKGSELLHGAEKAEMKEKLNQLHVEELELFLKRNELVREYAKVVLAFYENKMDEDA